MAIGLSLMFNVRLPMNFNSPYKATSIIEFWRRWHMTLSRFLRDYLYIPLGGSRNGPTHRYYKPDDHHAARRTLARRRLDVRDLGRAAWVLLDGEPRVALLQTSHGLGRRRQTSKSGRGCAYIFGGRLLAGFFSVPIAFRRR
jgi:hypothetical protein